MRARGSRDQHLDKKAAARGAGTVLVGSGRVVKTQRITAQLLCIMRPTAHPTHGSRLTVNSGCLPKRIDET